jgi:hypothetical protein
VQKVGRERKKNVFREKGDISDGGDGMSERRNWDE